MYCTFKIFKPPTPFVLTYLPSSVLTDFCRKSHDPQCVNSSSRKFSGTSYPPVLIQSDPRRNTCRISNCRNLHDAEHVNALCRFWLRGGCSRQEECFCPSNLERSFHSHLIRDLDRSSQFGSFLGGSPRALAASCECIYTCPRRSVSFPFRTCGSTPFSSLRLRQH